MFKWLAWLFSTDSATPSTQAEAPTYKRRCLAIINRLRNAVHPLDSTIDIKGLTLRTASRTRNILVVRHGAWTDEIRLAADDHAFEEPKGRDSWVHMRRGYSSRAQAPVLVITASDYRGQAGLEYTIEVNGAAPRHQGSFSEQDWELLHEILVALELDGSIGIEWPSAIGDQGKALLVKLKDRHDHEADCRKILECLYQQTVSRNREYVSGLVLTNKDSICFVEAAPFGESMYVTIKPYDAPRTPWLMGIWTPANGLLIRMHDRMPPWDAWEASRMAAVDWTVVHGILSKLGLSEQTDPKFHSF